MPRYQSLDGVATLQQALEGIIVDDLKKLNALLSGDRKLTRKADLVAAIKQQMQGLNLKQVWEQLDDLQKAAVAEVIHGEDSHYHANMFRAKYGEDPDWGTSERYGYNRQPSLLCLFIHRGTIPCDLAEELLRFVPEPQATTLNHVGDTLPNSIELQVEKYSYSTGGTIVEKWEVPLTVCEMELAATKDFTAVLRLIQSGKVSVSEKTLLPGVATMKAIASVLQGGEFYNDEQRKAVFEKDDILLSCEIGNIKSFAWCAIVQASKFAEISGKKLVLTKAGQKALQETPAKGLQTAWQRWLNTKTFDEFRRIDAIKGQTGRGANGMTDVTWRRDAIAFILAECPVGKWVMFGEFISHTLATGHGFEVTEEPYYLYISEAGYGNLGDLGNSDCYLLEERYTRCLLFEYAATLGIIDVAYGDPTSVPSDYSDLWGTDDLEFLSRYDGLIAFRLTALGAYCLGLTDNYSPPTIQFSQTLRVLPNLDIIVAGESIATSDAIVLDIFAKKVSDVVWRLDRSKIFAAIENGYSLAEFQEILETRSIEPLPQTVQQFLTDVAERSNSLQDLGTVKLIECKNAHLALLIANDSRTKKFCQLAGDRTLADLPFNLRVYQKEAAAAFYQDGEVKGGSGTIVLPCGAGKTIVGMLAMSLVKQKTLILTSSLTSVHQWRREILDKTSLTEDAIAEYSSATKQTAAVTLSTYQMLSYRSHKEDEFPHFELFNLQSWGLIIYDEVHLLPAPIFRITAELQARRRLGLTATLIREDGKEGDVFTLIGPKRYDVPWRELEGQGFIATANCTEIRIAQNEAEKMAYALAPRRQQFRIAAENPAKLETVQSLLQKEAGHRILIIGEYLEQLDAIAQVTQLPLITGKMKQKERDRLYEAFRHKEIPGLILSRVGNFAVDLPDADVLIQVSGKYGSRQEEAQRLGRILRPKSDGHTASFYTLVSLQTCEEDFARHRQLFLTEQGYNYRIEVQDDV